MVRTPRKQQYSALADIITGRPVVRSQRVKPAIKTNQSEADVLRDCLAYLSRTSFYYPLKYDRLNNGAGNLGAGFRQFGIKGAGDIIATLNGQHIEIECKAGKGGQLSIYQQARRAEIEAANGKYFIVYSATDLEREFQPLLAVCPKKPGIADFDNDPELQ